MNIEISSATALEFSKNLIQADKTELQKRLNLEERVKRYSSSSVSIQAEGLELEDMEILLETAKGEKDRRAVIQLNAIVTLIKNPEEAQVKTLKSLVPGLILFLTRNPIDGWIYSQTKDGVSSPWLIQGIIHREKNNQNQESVQIQIVARSTNPTETKTTTKTLYIYSDDIGKITIPEILFNKGYIPESQELKQTYLQHLDLFEKYAPMHSEQFLITGMGQIVGERSYNNEWINFDGNLPPQKVVNDDDLVERTHVEFTSNEFWEENGHPEMECKVPFHCNILTYHLGIHRPLWIHVSNLTPYIYQPDLVNKLILPQTHRDLINVLTEDLGILVEDIVAGKSGGTTILCCGNPGLGKTLTAEVYSEAILRPLYRIHSGQLGTTAETVEETLETILKRAARWKAVLLIDEADVYIRKRQNDLNHNAVVAGFLRTLEYFSGLLFMTTNLPDDVDDAIISRCIAIIAYDTPSPEDSRRIWGVLSKTLGVNAEENLLDELAVTYQGASGRDIKELLKLCYRYAKNKGILLDPEVFRKCAMFRAMPHLESAKT